jgi:hypothetical protein
MKRIAWWTIEVEWEDGKRESISDIPNWVAKNVDEFLTTVEEESANDSE